MRVQGGVPVRLPMPSVRAGWYLTAVFATWQSGNNEQERMDFYSTLKSLRLVTASIRFSDPFYR